MESIKEYPSSFNLHSILSLFFLPNGKESSPLRSALFLHVLLYISLGVYICGVVSINISLTHNTYVHENLFKHYDIGGNL